MLLMSLLAIILIVTNFRAEDKLFKEEQFQKKLKEIRKHMNIDIK